MKKILVGVDGSETAAEAARYAADLAVLLDADLHLVTVDEALRIQGRPGRRRIVADQRPRRGRVDAEGAGRHDARRRKVVCTVLDGDPAKAIVAEAEPHRGRR